MYAAGYQVMAERVNSKLENLLEGGSRNILSWMAPCSRVGTSPNAAYSAPNGTLAIVGAFAADVRNDDVWRSGQRENRFYVGSLMKRGQISLASAMSPVATIASGNLMVFARC